MPYRLMLCCLVCLLVMVQVVCGREFAVGGTKGWTIPSHPQVYNQWAVQSRFQIGDSLLFIYKQSQDSVLQVTQDAYESCNTETATEKFTDGHTSFMLNRSGPYYFISGNKENCHKNEKLVIIVMADRIKNINPFSSSPPPYGDFTPSPSYTGTLEITPGNTASSCSSSVFFTSVTALFIASVASPLVLDF